MVKDAEAHSEEDKRRREEIEVANHADSMAYQVERQLRELGDRVPSNEKARAEQLISETRSAVEEQLVRCFTSAAAHERPAADDPWIDGRGVRSFAVGNRRRLRSQNRKRSAGLGRRD